MLYSLWMGTVTERSEGQHPSRRRLLMGSGIVGLDLLLSGSIPGRRLPFVRQIRTLNETPCVPSPESGVIALYSASGSESLLFDLLHKGVEENKNNIDKIRNTLQLPVDEVFKIATAVGYSQDIPSSKITALDEAQQLTDRLSQLLGIPPSKYPADVYPSSGKAQGFFIYVSSFGKRSDC